MYPLRPFQTLPLKRSFQSFKKHHSLHFKFHRSHLKIPSPYPFFFYFLSPLMQPLRPFQTLSLSNFPFSHLKHHCRFYFTFHLLHLILPTTFPFIYLSSSLMHPLLSFQTLSLSYFPFSRLRHRNLHFKLPLPVQNSLYCSLFYCPFSIKAPSSFISNFIAIKFAFLPLQHSLHFKFHLSHLKLPLSFLFFIFLSSLIDPLRPFQTSSLSKSPFSH